MFRCPGVKVKYFLWGIIKCFYIQSTVLTILLLTYSISFTFNHLCIHLAILEMAFYI